MLVRRNKLHHRGHGWEFAPTCTLQYELWRIPSSVLSSVRARIFFRLFAVIIRSSSFREVINLIAVRKLASARPEEDNIPSRDAVSNPGASQKFPASRYLWILRVLWRMAHLPAAGEIKRATDVIASPLVHRFPRTAERRAGKLKARLYVCARAHKILIENEIKTRF